MPLTTFITVKKDKSSGRPSIADKQEYEAKYAKYDKDWLFFQINQLVQNGVIENKSTIVSDLNIGAGHLSDMLSGRQRLSPNFIDSFRSKYARHLKVEIPVKLTIGEAKVILPEGYGKGDLERISKVLAAYK